MPSAELSILRSPQRAYAALAAASPPISWLAALRRPVVSALVVGSTMATVATGAADGIVVVRTTAAWSFIVAVQLLGAAVLIAFAPQRRVSPARALDLIFAANGPWSLWLAAFTAWTLLTTPIGRSLHPVLWSLFVPGVWTAWLIYAYCMEVLGLTRRAAIRRTLLHQSYIWLVIVLYFSWAVQVWPRAIQVWRGWTG